MLGLLALVLLAHTARASDGEAQTNLRGAAVHKEQISSYAPSASCADDATWSYGTKASNTCAYVARKLKRCKAKNTDGVRTALEACPLTCGTC